MLLAKECATDTGAQYGVKPENMGENGWSLETLQCKLPVSSNKTFLNGKKKE